MERDSADPYAYPGSSVLRNIPGIRSEPALRTFEYEATKLRIEEMRESPIPGSFDLAHLKAIHAHVFQDVYEWAGQTRTVGLRKNGDRFVPPGLIEGTGAALGQALKKADCLRGLEKPAFVDRLSAYYANLNALHPFREGNGRVTREFVGQLARAAGYDLDQTRIDNDKDQWNDASRRSFQGDLAPLREIFSEAIRPERAIAFEKLSEPEARALFPELSLAYDGLRAIEQLARSSMGGDSPAVAEYMGQVRAQFVARLEKGQLVDRSRDSGRVTSRGVER